MSASDTIAPTGLNPALAGQASPTRRLAMLANSEGSPEAARPAFSDTSQQAQALDAVAQAVAIFGHDGRIAYANGACRLLYGYRDRELVGPIPSVA